MLVGLSVVIAVVALVLGGAYAFQRQLIYLPDEGPLPEATEVLPAGRDIELSTADGVKLDAWFFPAPRAQTTVLVAPGNAGDRSVRAPLARALHARGISVLLLDYRGYGGNAGSPTEAGLALDVRAACDFLTLQEQIPASELVYYGESLGAAVVAELATERPPAAMVLRSPFTDLVAMARNQFPFLPVGWLLKDRFPVLQYVRDSSVPLTVVHGSADSIVPPAQSTAVAEAGGGRIVEVPGANHNDASLLDGDELIDAVVAASRS